VLNKIKFIIKLTGGVAVIVGALWYLAGQFASIDAQLTQVVSIDIPKIKSTFEENSDKTEKIKTDMSNIAQRFNDLGDQAENVKKIEIDIGLLAGKIDDEVISEISKLESENKQNIEEVKVLAQKIDNLSKQYVKFLNLSKDKITVSIPPKWVDELPYRNGTIFTIGVSLSNNKLNKVQQSAVEQARFHMAIMLERKTINAIAYTIESAGKLPPNNFDELSEKFKEQITDAINELLFYSQVESYWVDPAGYVYALVSLPVKDIIDGSKFGVLVETLNLTHISITEALKQDFKKQLKVELLK